MNVCVCVCVCVCVGGVVVHKFSWWKFCLKGRWKWETCWGASSTNQLYEYLVKTRLEGGERMPFSEAVLNSILAWFLTLGREGGNWQAGAWHTELKSERRTEAHSGLRVAAWPNIWYANIVRCFLSTHRKVYWRGNDQGKNMEDRKP